MDKILLQENRYADSVSLMRVSEALMRLPGVTAAEVQMATAANIRALAEMGFAPPEGATPGDMLIALRADSAAALAAAEEKAIALLDRRGAKGKASYRSLEEMRAAGECYDLAQISLPGEYAAAEARKALEMGMDVFIFSDNVPLAQELELKQLGRERGRLVMGPDCGVGFMGGVCLGAGSIVAAGPVGIVAASGSGAQEVASILERCGVGISSIIGTGGHDLFPEIGGLSMLAGLARLEEDPDTEVIVLVSKLADQGVMEKVLAAAEGGKKPVVACFLGAEEGLFASRKIAGAASLEEAALQAAELLRGARPSFGKSEAELEKTVEAAVEKLPPARKYFRGLYCGGTFTEEALVYFNRHNAGKRLYSNLRNRYAQPLADARQSEGDTILDLGAEDFTAAAPHPVFDPANRLQRFEQELADSEVAVILLDFITGPGVHEDPITPFAEACRRAGEQGDGPVFIATVCGGARDPQNIEEKMKLLEDAGVILAESNLQSARIASAMMAALEKRG